MTSHVFVPVPTKEMKSFTKDWAEGRKAQGKQLNIIEGPSISSKHVAPDPRSQTVNRVTVPLRDTQRRGIMGGKLKNVGANDKLYVLAHGNSLGSSLIGAKRGAVRDKNDIKAWTGGTMTAFDHEQLGHLLFNEGLSLAFRDLRIFACGSGNVPATHGVTASFGQRLRDYMRDTLGFFNLTVTGYLGGIMTAYEVHIMPNRQDQADRARKGVIIDGVIYPASTQKIRF